MSNDKGTWFGWDVSKVGPIEDKSVYESAKNFAEKVSKGAVQAKPETQEATKKTINLQFLGIGRQSESGTAHKKI